MKSRKPTFSQQKALATELLINEINLKKLCLESATKKVEEITEQIKAGDTSKKTKKALAEQREIALSIKAWLESHKKSA